MNITHSTRQSPLKRNGATTYVRQYLNAVGDWQTYAGIDPTRPQAVGDAVRRLTLNYFSPAKLKGAAIIFAAQLTQQLVATLLTGVVRTVIHGAPLDTVQGIVVRRSDYHRRWNRLRPDRLADIAEMADSFYFHEGGRTWHAYTLKIRLWGETRVWSALSLLGLPGRSYYFDRPLAYPQAVPLALGLVPADSIAGFLGDTTELDGLVPPLKSLKLGLYLLDWLLVDPSERDGDLPQPMPYSDLTPPAGNTGYGSPAAPGTSYPPRHPGGFYGGYTAPAAYAPYPNGNGVAPAYSAPFPYNGNGVAQPYAPPAVLSEQPVSVLITRDGREQWHTIHRNAFAVRTPDGRDTGLAITPAIELLADGRVVEHDTRWNITHLGSGRQLNRSPFTDRNRVQQVAASLLVIDWTRAVADIPPADLQRAQTILNGRGAGYVQ